jgi:crotonobetainyl-CoA:carnitine CoA-transferase CaiB-like acyl-CoA transferase
MPFNFNGQSTEYVNNNCGKKSLGIDLKAEGAFDLIMELAAECDVVIQNFRPGTLERFGLTYEAFKKANPSIIMCNISGWGQNGELANRGGADITAQAQSGILDLTGEPGKKPVFVGINIGDILGGLNAFGAICAALYRRAVTGEGEYIDIALVDCIFATLRNEVPLYLWSNGQQRRERVGSFHYRHSPFGIYEGKDGYMVISCPRDSGFARFADIMGKPELAQDPRFDTMAHRFANNAELTAEIEEWLKQYDQIEDAALVLQEMRIMAAPVMSVGDVIEKDPQMEVRERLKEINHPDLGRVKVLNTPIRTKNNKAGVEGLPPLIPGEHTDYVLSSVMNKSQAEIDQLRSNKVVFTERHASGDLK